jgi:hypothetical protein
LASNTLISICIVDNALEVTRLLGEFAFFPFIAILTFETTGEFVAFVVIVDKGTLEGVPGALFFHWLSWSSSNPDPGPFLVSCARISASLLPRFTPFLVGDPLETTLCFVNDTIRRGDVSFGLTADLVGAGPFSRFFIRCISGTRSGLSISEIKFSVEGASTTRLGRLPYTLILFVFEEIIAPAGLEIELNLKRELFCCCGSWTELRITLRVDSYRINFIACMRTIEHYSPGLRRSAQTTTNTEAVWNSSELACKTRRVRSRESRAPDPDSDRRRDWIGLLFRGP